MQSALIFTISTTGKRITWAGRIEEGVKTTQLHNSRFLTFFFYLNVEEVPGPISLKTAWWIIRKRKKGEVGYQVIGVVESVFMK